MPSPKVTEKKERGKMKVFSTLQLTVFRWVLDKVVTVASNVLTINLWKLAKVSLGLRKHE